MNLSEHLRDARDIGDFAHRYADRLHEALLSIDPAAVVRMAEVLEACRQRNGTAWVIGNGGSAANANHIANGLASHLLNRAGRGFPVASLTSNNVALTAISNDEGFERVFLGQLRVFWRTGDVLLAISCSGHSPNIVEAAQWVRDQSGTVVGLCGFDGGKLAELADPAIVVRTEAGEYGPVEDAHMALAHVLVHWYESRG